VPAAVTLKVALSLSNIQSSDEGTYAVVVTNAVNTVTSASAVLTIVIPPSITVQPQNKTVNEGQTATFSVTATGTAPLSYQWQEDGEDILGATNSIYQTAILSDDDDGDIYKVVVSNAAGNVTSDNATLTVNEGPIITTQPQSQSVAQGASTSFTVVAQGSGSLTYQWKKDGTNLPGETNTTLSLSNIRPSDAGAYTVVVTNSVNSVTSVNAVLTVVIPPSITVQPQDVTKSAGETAPFNFSVTGTSPLSYQWQNSGGDISGATSATYVTNVLTGDDDGETFRVIVSNSAGKDTSNYATLTVKVPPSIISQPLNATVIIGSTKIISVTAIGSAPLAYQWKKNAVDLTGETSASIILTNIQLAASGYYSVVISNTAASIESDSAFLTVLPVIVSPVIIIQPKNVSVNSGSSATFSVSAIGTGPLSYQWQDLGGNIPGATSATYVTAVLTGGDDGKSFRVLVSNLAGTDTSNYAAVSINVAPTITTHPINIIVRQWEDSSLSVIATGTKPFSYQWKKGDVNIIGATDSILVFTNMNSPDNGNYKVEVSNIAGSVTSNVANVFVCKNNCN